MIRAERATTPTLRTLLVLGRVSNLPTVWSNCLAGWLLGGGGSLGRLAWLCLGATALYIGGMYLNDAFDADFDRQHRSERPIPTGAVSARLVWQLGFLFVGSGLVALSLLGWRPGLLAGLLTFCILLYDAVHKMFAFSPVLMAMCRLLLALTAAAVGDRGITGLSIWSAAVLGCYVVGLSYIARRESVRGPLRYWPLIPLAAPLVLALIVNQGGSPLKATLLGGLLVVWISWSLHFALTAAQRNIGRSVSGLLAGIVWVDLLAVGPDLPLPMLALFGLLFVSALLFQRVVPAT